jgi:hypothetical protein
MNPFLILIKELLRNKIILLSIGAATGVSVDSSLPFLAKVIHPNRLSESRVIINSARKERVALEAIKDSINKLDTINTEETANRELYEEVNRSISILTDVQLDSLLTKYRDTVSTKD